MIRQRYDSRLSVKFGVVGALALIIAFSVFFTLYSGVTWWILHGSSFEKFWDREGMRAVESFQEYVTENGLSMEDALRDAAWEQKNNTINLYLSPREDNEMWQQAFQDSNIYGRPVTCSNGIIYAYAEPDTGRYDLVGMMISLGMAAISFFLVMIPYIWHIIRRISRLSQEMDILTGGDLTYQIEADGDDELGELAISIEEMRKSVLDQMAKENEAVLANSRLITSLSHDLRTPLTKLTGYLEILRYQKYAGEEKREEYLNRALEKAEQMKELSDEMFRNFRVKQEAKTIVEEPANSRKEAVHTREEAAPIGTGIDSIGTTPDDVSGALLLAQMLEEFCFDLENEGFTAELPVLDRDFRFEMGSSDLRRIFDNLYSNLIKYGDPAEPICIGVDLREEEILIELKNKILEDSSARSSGVGLPTVIDLLKRSEGSMEHRREGGLFITVLHLHRLD